MGQGFERLNRRKLSKGHASRRNPFVFHKKLYEKPDSVSERVIKDELNTVHKGNRSTHVENHRGIEEVTYILNR